MALLSMTGTGKLRSQIKGGWLANERKNVAWARKDELTRHVTGK